MTQKVRKSGWYLLLRRRLVDVPRPFWWALLTVSAAAHVVAVGVMLLLLFGGDPQSGDAADGVPLVAAQTGPEDVELTLETVPPVERPQVSEQDLAEWLEVPLDAVMADFQMSPNQMAAPAMPMPRAAMTRRAAASGGLISGTPQSFADYIKHLQQTGIDVVFLIDATGSMVWVHKKVVARMQALAAYVRNLVPLARFGVIAYRDYGDMEFVTRIAQPSFDSSKARDFMAGIDASGGGDRPEAVTQALRDAETAIDWRGGAQRVLIVIGDAPPHPRETAEAAEIAERMKRRGARLSLIDSRVEANRAYLGRGADRSVDLAARASMPQFRRLARLGGGTAATLSAERQLMKTLALLIFDDRFHDELAPFLANLE